VSEKNKQKAKHGMQRNGQISEKKLTTPEKEEDKIAQCKYKK
jgi:hypothetical protein